MMSEGPDEASKDDTSRSAESFATWLSLFGVSPAGTPVPAKPAAPTKRTRKDHAPSDGDDAPSG